MEGLDGWISLIGWTVGGTLTGESHGISWSAPETAPEAPKHRFMLALPTRRSKHSGGFSPTFRRPGESCRAARFRPPIF